MANRPKIASDPFRVPEPGELVEVRRRQWLVSDVDPYMPSGDAYRRQDLVTLESIEEDAGGDAVTLSTVHAAKGLEYPVVFAVGMEHGLFPHERALTEGSEDEEKRLFYVAVTRARSKLVLTRAKLRLVRGVPHMPRESEFLGLLSDGLAERHVPEELLRAPDPSARRKAFADIFKILDEED